MLTEMHGKAGRVCQSAMEGKQRCPLIVRPSSEDVITGNLCQVLRILNPRCWVSDLLNLAVGAPRFPRQVYRRWKIEPWQNQARYPRELLPWDEGSTQVDLVIEWENPPTTVYIEMKYGSDLSWTTAGSNGQHGYPSDQLVRNARVGLLQCGWFDRNSLLDLPPRDFVLVFCSPMKGHRLVQRYRNPERFLASVPHSSQLRGLPRLPFIGDLSYLDIIHVLRHRQRWLCRPERQLVDDLCNYLIFKSRSIPAAGGPRQSEIGFPE
jgi:hypothetical protein